MEVISFGAQFPGEKLSRVAAAVPAAVLLLAAHDAARHLLLAAESRRRRRRAEVDVAVDARRQLRALQVGGGRHAPETHLADLKWKEGEVLSGWK